MAVAQVAPRKQAKTTSRVSGRAWWRIAQELMRVGGIDAPTNAAEADALIKRLLAAQPVDASAEGGSDGIPF